jgi:hypothetical protein
MRRSGSGVCEASTISRLNIDHYRRLLATDTDESKRQTVMRLLAEEEAKLSKKIEECVPDRSNRRL